MQNSIASRFMFCFSSFSSFNFFSFLYLICLKEEKPGFPTVLEIMCQAIFFTLMQTFYYYKHPFISNTFTMKTLSVALCHEQHYFSNTTLSY